MCVRVCVCVDVNNIIVKKILKFTFTIHALTLYHAQMITVPSMTSGHPCPTFVCLVLQDL